MKDSIKVFTNPYIFSSNVYVINFKWSIIVIDPWFYDWELFEYIKSLWKVDAVLLTHGHWDHIREIDRIKTDYPDTKVYIHKDDVEMLTNTGLNCSLLVWAKDIVIKSEINQLEEWDLKICDIPIKVIHVPGHTYWWVMYYFEELNSLFLWDTVMWESIWTLSTPTWNENLMRESLNKFKNLQLSFDTNCYPGHWDVEIYWDILKYNPFLN